MTTTPCAHAKPPIILCSRCLMGRADAVAKAESTIPPLGGPEKSVLVAPVRSRGPSRRQGKLQKAREAFQAILNRDTHV